MSSFRLAFVCPLIFQSNPRYRFDEARFAGVVIEPTKVSTSDT